MSENDEISWAAKLAAGPNRVGDPDDNSLRRVEKEVLIPKIVRERSKTEKCLKYKEDFDQCCLKNGPLMVFQCRRQNNAFKECMNEWFHNRAFYDECQQIYLEKRAEFRRTGVKVKRELPGNKSNSNNATEKSSSVS